MKKKPKTRDDSLQKKAKKRKLPKGKKSMAVEQEQTIYQKVAMDFINKKQKPAFSSEQDSILESDDLPSIDITSCDNTSLGKKSFFNKTMTNGKNNIGGNLLTIPGLGFKDDDLASVRSGGSKANSRMRIRHASAAVAKALGSFNMNNLG